MGATESKSHWGLVLAGGDGIRLQALTREITGAPIPKQYCRIVGNRSLLEATLDRARHFAPRRRTMIILNRDHLAIGREQIRTLPSTNVVVQPCNRDTGPGLLLALLHLAERDPDATVAVFPSDHYVADDRVFVGHVRRAARLVSLLPDKIALLGICPEHPEPGYGYILPSHRLRSPAQLGPAFHVCSFREKPSPDDARRLVRGGALWNSFVMVFRVARMLDLLRSIARDEIEDMTALRRNPSAIPGAYLGLRPWNFSSHFLARVAEHMVVLPVDNVHWNDWGTRESIERTFRLLNQPPPWQSRPQASVAA